MFAKDIWEAEKFAKIVMLWRYFGCFEVASTAVLAALRPVFWINIIESRECKLANILFNCEIYL